MGEKRAGNFRIILAFAHIAALAALPGSDEQTDLNLSCTNAFNDSISCRVSAERCSEISLTVRSDSWSDERNCSLQQCNVGPCCCSVDILLTLLDTHTVTIWRRGRRVESKKFNVKESMKPETPTIESVEISNGNFEVKWDTNMERIAKDSLTAEVTYYKVSDMKKKRVSVNPPTVSGKSFYQISGHDLEPSTTYMVSVRSITNWSGKMSDSSKEFEFKTPASSNTLLLTVIVSLSVAAVLLSGAIYICCDKLKSKWWDVVTKYPNPKLIVMHSSEQEVLRPVQTIISSISVNPMISDDSKQWSKMSVLDLSGGSQQHSSGISTGSSDLSYASTEPGNVIASVQDALCKVFPNIGLMSQLPSTLEERNKNTGLLSILSGSPANEMSYGSSGLMNKTYLIVMPHEKNSPEVHMQTEIPGESTYCPNGRGVLDNIHQQPPVLPVPAHQEFCFPSSGGSSSMEMDLSYQPCNPESGTFSEGSTLSSFSSGANTAMSSDLEYRDGADFGIVDEAVSGAPKLEGSFTPDINACSISAQSALLVDDDYQPFQNLVGQLDVLPLKPTRLQPEKHLDRQKEDLQTKIPQNLLGPAGPGFTDHAQSSQTPFLQFLPAERFQSVIVDSDYHSV